MNKGQITFEFIMLLLVLLFFIITVVNPTASMARASTEDIQRFSDAVVAGKKLASAINYAASTSEGTKIPVTIFLPTPSVIDVTDKTLTITANLKGDGINIQVTGSDKCEPIGGADEEEEFKTSCTKTIQLLQDTDDGSVNLDATQESKSLTVFVVKESEQVKLTAG